MSLALANMHIKIHNGAGVYVQDRLHHDLESIEAHILFCEIFSSDHAKTSEAPTSERVVGRYLGSTAK